MGVSRLSDTCYLLGLIFNIILIFVWLQKGFSGQVYYENLCYKAVNQCIGRAVRHIGDYSAIILMDKRYSSKVKFLPAWIQRSNVTVNSTFGATISSVAKFFASKRKVKTNWEKGSTLFWSTNYNLSKRVYCLVLILQALLFENERTCLFFIINYL